MPSLRGRASAPRNGRQPAIGHGGRDHRPILPAKEGKRTFPFLFEKPCAEPLKRHGQCPLPVTWEGMTARLDDVARYGPDVEGSGPNRRKIAAVAAHRLDAGRGRPAPRESLFVSRHSGGMQEAGPAKWKGLATRGGVGDRQWEGWPGPRPGRLPDSRGWPSLAP